MANSSKAKGVTYKDTPDRSRVFLDGRCVGHIKKAKQGGWFYAPHGSSQTGDVKPTRADVKRSLES
jgi:hypothetical protein